MERQQVDGLRDEGKLGLVSKVHTPNQVVDGLVTVVDLVGERPLTQVQQRRTHREIGGEYIIQIDTEHTLVGLVGVIGLGGDLDGRAGSQDALVDDGHHTHIVVDSVIDILDQLDTASGHLHRLGGTAAREMEFRSVRRSVATLDVVLVLVGDLLRHGLRHRVQRIEGILVGQLRIVQHGTQVLTERLRGGEIDTSVRGVDGTAVDMGTVDEVEDTIRRGILMLVQTVETHQTNQRNALLRTLREESVRRTLHIAGVQNVQAELVGRNLIGRQAIDVLHHQLPQRRLGVQAGALQQLDTNTVGGGHLIGELTDLIHLVVTDHRVLERHSQHLVGGEGGVQRDETQLGVHGILIGAEQTRTLHFLVVRSRLHADGLHVARHVGNVPDQRAVGVGRQVVDVVVGILPTRVSEIVRQGGKLRIILTQIGESHNVTVVRSRSTDRRAPHLDLGNHDRRTHQRQRAEVLVVMLFEEVADEEVLVLFVLVGSEVEIGLLGTALHRNGLGGTFLARSNRRDVQVAELELGLDTEQTLATVDQRAVQRERNVAELNQL